MSVNNRIERFFRPQILAMSAYRVADAKNLIKLDAMENPYPWPENLKQQWLNVLRDSPMNRYPDPKAQTLVERLRQSQHIPSQLDVLLGNGSDEIIQLLIMALKPDTCVLSTAPSFVMYQQISRCLGLDYHAVELNTQKFDLDLAAMLRSIESHQPGLIFLAYPNNPTGNLFDTQALDAIICAAPGLVIIDEAYAPFANASFIEKIASYDNVLVMRTVSKLGLAGLRLGYLIGKPVLIEQLDKIRLPYNINILTQISADFALEHQVIFEQQTQAICQERSRLFAELSDIEEIDVYPSAANFILFKLRNALADTIFEGIKRHGVLIKNLHPQGGMLTNCLRVTIGMPEENDAFLLALKTALAQ